MKTSNDTIRAAITTYAVFDGTTLRCAGSSWTADDMPASLVSHIVADDKRAFDGPFRTVVSIDVDGEICDDPQPGDRVVRSFEPRWPKGRLDRVVAVDGQVVALESGHTGYYPVDGSTTLFRVTLPWEGGR